MAKYKSGVSKGLLSLRWQLRFRAKGKTVFDSKWMLSLSFSFFLCVLTARGWQRYLASRSEKKGKERWRETVLKLNSMDKAVANGGIYVCRQHDDETRKSKIYTVNRSSKCLTFVHSFPQLRYTSFIYQSVIRRFSFFVCLPGWQIDAFSFCVSFQTSISGGVDWKPHSHKGKDEKVEMKLKRKLFPRRTNFPFFSNLLLLASVGSFRRFWRNIFLSLRGLWHTISTASRFSFLFISILQEIAIRKKCFFNDPLSSTQFPWLPDGPPFSR